MERDFSKAHLRHPNPAVRAMRERVAKVFSDKPEMHKTEGDHGPVHRTEVEHDRHTGKHMVKAHHEDGHVATSEHGSAHEAHSHAAGLMHEGSVEHGQEDNPLLSKPDPAEENAGEAKAAMGMNEEAGGASGSGEISEEGESSCPQCGAKMKGGKCEDCGYDEEEGGGDGEA